MIQSQYNISLSFVTEIHFSLWRSAGLVSYAGIGAYPVKSAALTVKGSGKFAIGLRTPEPAKTKVSFLSIDYK
jgi:hypothetical protein